MNLHTHDPGPSRAIVLTGEHAETATPAPSNFDGLRDPIRLLRDAPDEWRVLRGPFARENFRTGQGITWGDARAKVAEATIRDGSRTDRGLGAADRLVVDVDDRGMLYMTAAATRGGQLAPLFSPVPVRAHAFRQLAQRIKAPAPYLTRLPAKLALACVQVGLTARAGSEEDSTALLRLAGGEARALVSSRYAVLDDLRFLDVAEAALAGAGVSLDRIRVASVATGARTALRLTFPHTVTRVDGAEDQVEVGLDLLNGELGNASASVLPLVYRLVCSNGMRAWASSGNKRVVRHVGDPARAVEILRDAIPAAIDDATGAIDAIKVATRTVIANAVEAFGGLRLFGLTAPEIRAAEGTLAASRGVALPAERKGTAFSQAWDQIGAVSAWDVTNAVTRAAHQHGTERRLELETAAGSYLRAAID